MINSRTKKRTCNRCVAEKAMLNNNGPAATKCELGYRVSCYGTGEPFRHGYIPQEKCPKPLTYRDYIECTKWYRKIE